MFNYNYIFSLKGIKLLKYTLFSQINLTFVSPKNFRRKKNETEDPNCDVECDREKKLAKANQQNRDLKG